MGWGWEQLLGGGEGSTSCRAAPALPVSEGALSEAAKCKILGRCLLNSRATGGRCLCGCSEGAPWPELRSPGDSQGHLPESPVLRDLPRCSCGSSSTFPALHGVSNTSLWTQRCSFAKGLHKLTSSSGFLLQNLSKYFLALQAAGLKGELENQAIIFRVHLNSSLKNSCWTPFSRRSSEASSFQILSDINYCFKRQLCCNKAMSIHSWNWQSANWVSSWSEWLEA